MTFAYSCVFRINDAYTTTTAFCLSYDGCARDAEEVTDVHVMLKKIECERI